MKRHEGTLDRVPCGVTAITGFSPFYRLFGLDSATATA